MEEKDIEIQHYNIFEIPADCRTEVWSELLYGNIFKFLKVKNINIEQHIEIKQNVLKIFYYIKIYALKGSFK